MNLEKHLPKKFKKIFRELNLSKKEQKKIIYNLYVLDKFGKKNAQKILMYDLEWINGVLYYIVKYEHDEVLVVQKDYLCCYLKPKNNNARDLKDRVTISNDMLLVGDIDKFTNISKKFLEFFL